MAWEEGRPWEVWLEVREEEGGTAGCPPRCAGGTSGWARRRRRSSSARRDSCSPAAGSRASPEGNSRWASLLDSEKALRVPAAERDELLARLLAAPDLPRLELPESMRFEEARTAPRPRLRLLPPPAARRLGRARSSPSSTKGVEVPAGAPGRGVYQQEERRLLLRDREAERRSARPPAGAGLPARTDPPPGEPALRIPASRVPKAVRALLAEGWPVEAEGKLYRPPAASRWSIASGIDWFELHGEADFEGETVRLPELLAALRRGEKFVAAGRRQPRAAARGVAEEARRRWPASGQPEGDHLRFRPGQAALLDAWLADEPEATLRRGVRARPRAPARLRGHRAGRGAARVPRRAARLPARRAGLAPLPARVRLRRLPGRRHGPGQDGAGAGPARSAAAPRAARPKGSAVAGRRAAVAGLQLDGRGGPASRRELRVLDYTGAGRRARDGESFADYDLVLTTYGTLRRDIGDAAKIEFDYVILDEAQAIKNADSQTAKAARLLRGRHRLALTGTPVENHLGELWSLFEFLNPGMLGASPSSAHARRRAARSRTPRRRELLARALRPFILRRTKEQVATELPAKIEQTLYCELAPAQRQLYDELRDHYRGAARRAHRRAGARASRRSRCSRRCCACARRPAIPA